MSWVQTPFDSILSDSKDGEWGEGEEAPGLRQCLVIRGTDFTDLDNPSKEFPLRWIKNHIVDRKILQAGDIILEAAGGTSTQSTGRTTLLKESFFHQHSDLPVLCASFSRYLRLKRELSPAFVYYLLQILYRSGYMAVYNIQHTGVSRFQYTSFKKHTKLLLPDISAQDKIAAVLTAYDDLIGANKRRIALLEKMAEEIYREWFVRMRFPGHQDAKFFKGMPEGWAMTKIDKAFEFTGGGTPSKAVPSYWNNGTMNWFTPSDITRSTGIFLSESEDQCSEEGLARSSARIFPAYSVMMTSRATIGAIGINTKPACTNQGFITCIPNIRFPLPYLYLWLKLSKPFFEQLCGGSTFPELTKGTFKTLEILTPPEAVVDRFNQISVPLLTAVENLLEQNRTLTKTRNLLLPRLISGKLSVADLDIQFPPSMRDDIDAPNHRE